MIKKKVIRLYRIYNVRHICIILHQISVLDLHIQFSYGRTWFVYTLQPVYTFLN